MKRVFFLLLLFLLFTSVSSASGNNVQRIITATDDTPVYNKPIAHPSNLVMKLRYGTWFQNYTFVNGWYVVPLENGTNVYISAKQTVSYSPYANYIHHQVSTKEAYVFSTPSSTSKSRAVLPKGTLVTSFGVSGDFYYVYFTSNNQERAGFISKTVVQNLPVKQPQIQKPPADINEFLLYSNDGRTYLGKLTPNSFDPESVCNEFGSYGSKYSSTSIWNEFGTYGSEFSSESSFNKYTTTPPVIISNGKIVGYLTVNSLIPNSISPYGICK